MEEPEQTLQPVTFQLIEQVETQQRGCVEGWNEAVGSQGHRLQWEQSLRTGTCDCSTVLHCETD